MRENVSSTSQPAANKGVVLISLLLCLSLFMLTPSAMAASGISIAKIVSTSGYATGSPGVITSFNITIKNSGDESLSSVILTDLMPRGMTYTGASLGPTSWSLNSNGTTTIIWNLGSMNPGASKTIFPRGTRNGLVFGSLANIAMVSGIDVSNKAIASQSTCAVTALKPDIKIVESVSPFSGPPCAEIAFAINIYNTGNDTFSSARAIDLLPNDLSFMADGASPKPDRITNYANGTTNLTWTDIGSLGFGGIRTISFKARFSGQSSGRIRDNIRIFAKPPKNAYTVYNSSSTEISALRSSIDVSEAEPASQLRGAPGTNIEFSINIANTGEVPLYLANLTDILPQGLTYVSSSPLASQIGSMVQWTNLGSISPGSSLPVRLTARIDGSTFGILENKIAATGKPISGCNVTDEESIEMTAYRASIQVIHTPYPASGGVGSNIDFKIDIINTGEVGLNTIRLIDLLPKGLSYSSSSIDPIEKKIHPDGTSEVTWNNILTSPLSPGASTSLYLTAKMDGTKTGALKNNITVIGCPPSGYNITIEDWKVVTALKSGVRVAEVPVPSSGGPDTFVDFSINLTNVGDLDLDSIELVDLLPNGLNYSSASINPDSQQVNSNGSKIISWNNILSAPLSPGSSTSIYLRAKIDGTVFGHLQNAVAVIGKSLTVDVVEDAAIASVYSLEPAISMISLPSRGSLGTNIIFDINITNANNPYISLINIVDLLPTGLSYISSQPQGSRRGNAISWSSPKDLQFEKETHIKLVARIDGRAFGGLDNHVTMSGIFDGSRILKANSSAVNAVAPVLSVNKTASKKIVNRGDVVDYIIEISNPGDFPVEDVTVRDIFDSRVEFISSSPLPDKSGAWHFDVINPHSSLVIALSVRVPITEIIFSADQKISGEGFVRAAQDYSTTLQQYSLNNQVIVNAKGFQLSAQESVIVSSEPGTELKSREHGSGSYLHNEIARLCTKNRSVEVSKILAAKAYPTTFVLPGKRLTNFSSRWSELTLSKNQVTNTSTAELCSHASRISKDSILKLDENGTDMDINVNIEGMAHLGFLKRSTDSASDYQSSISDHQYPAFESSEDYAGSVSIVEHLDEYGEEVQFNRSVAGSGTVDADKHIRHSQRTHESGSGDYQIEELIDTTTSFMAKNIKLVNHPIKYRYLPGLSINSSRLWKEGMWSKAEGSSYIGEGFEDLYRLQKKTTMAGLNQMETTASFSGRTRFEAMSANTVKLVSEQAGNFSLVRKLLLKGVSRYDRPHITLANDGQTRLQRINGRNVTMAKYRIGVLNDGNVAIGPLYIKDLLPPDAQFINSSMKPRAMDAKYINWTIMNLGIGDAIEIDLWLEVDERSADLVNRVEACGAWDDHSICASNISSLQFNWLPCCPPEIYITKTASIDPSRPKIVRYAIVLENHANYTMIAEVSDHLPDGLRFLNSSVAPSEQSQNAVRWTVMNLSAGKSKSFSVVYWAEASRNGKFINLARVDAWSVGGEGSASAEASAEVVIDSVYEKGEKSKTDSSCMQINCTNEPISVNDWNQEPLADCSGPCPVFSGFFEEEIP